MTISASDRRALSISSRNNVKSIASIFLEGQFMKPVLQRRSMEYGLVQRDPFPDQDCVQLRAVMGVDRRHIDATRVNDARRISVTDQHSLGTGAVAHFQRQASGLACRELSHRSLVNHLAPVQHGHMRGDFFHLVELVAGQEHRAAGLRR